MTDPPSSSAGDIKLNYEKLTLTQKSTVLLTVTPANTEVEWSVSNKQIAVVSENGRVSIKTDALSNGGVGNRLETRTVDIIAKTATGKEAKCEITVCDHRYDMTSKKCLYCEFPLPTVNEGKGEIDNTGALYEWGSNIVDEKVEITEGVVGINEKAFSGRTGAIFHPSTDNFKSVTIPSSMWSIEKNAFYGCEYLKDVYYNGTKEEWKSILFLGSGDIGLSDDVTIHGYEADGITETTWKYKEE
ncbi:MAG: leucine-rich repeat protein [Treponema sp.]|nr:leucine-rich repeat protein [Treponema sp.]